MLLPGYTTRLECISVAKANKKNRWVARGTPGTYVAQKNTAKQLKQRASSVLHCGIFLFLVKAMRTILTVAFHNPLL